jgi:glycerophosphoryl diester phosphodiesterase
MIRLMRRKKKEAERMPMAMAKHYAHRGFHDKPLVPENSMAAFRRAVAHGFGSEFDVHLIADGSLVIFHDEQLERQTGVKGEIEDYDITNLKKLRLEGTDEQIPTFDEVLDLYEDTGLPLVIELKSSRGNYRKLAEAACRRLDSYSGDFVLESFDPRVMAAVRKIRPDFIRGQLVQNFFVTRDGLPMWQAALMTFLKTNTLVKPDFIAFRFRDRDTRALGFSLRKSFRREGAAKVTWTITTPEDYREAVRSGMVPILEQFDPDEI